MVAFETVIKEAISSQELPGCVLVSTSRDGTFSYTKAFGASSMESDSAAPLALDSIMWVASCTKLMTSVCAMQLVERGLLDLDESVYKHIPELERLPVLTGFEEGSGKPIEDKSTQPITLRMLLTHSSGLAYDAIHPKTLAWLAYHKRAPNSHGKLIERFSAPLVFEPGSGWAYGPSIDYAGLLVERITGLTLEAYMRQNLWEPLGIKDMTFHLHSRPDLRARMADMSVRDETGKVRWTGAPMTYQDGEGREVEDCFGGQGCFLSAEEYLKVLRAVLSTEEDERVLKKDTLEMFFKESLGKGSREALNAMLQDDFTNNAMGGTSKTAIKDWGLGGLLLTDDALDGKKAGTMIWGGLPNLRWWIDRKTGLCGLFACQVLPPGDAKCVALTSAFEEGMYEMYKQSRESGSRL